MKKLKLKTNDIIGLFESMSKISDEKMTFKTAVKIATNIDKLRIIYTQFETKRSYLIKQYAQKDENGNVIVMDDNRIKIENVNAFNSSISEIMEEEFEIELEELSVDEFEDVKISANDVCNIKKTLK